MVINLQDGVSRLRRIVTCIGPNQKNQPNLDLYLVRRYKICHFPLVVWYFCIGQNQKNHPNLVLYLVRRYKIFISVTTLNGMNNSKVKNVGSDHLVTKDADCWLIWSISDLGVIMGEKERARREEICVPIELYHMPAGRPMPSLSGIFSLKHESSIFRSVICMWFCKCQASSPCAKQYRA